MLEGVLIILMAGFIAGELAARVHLPRLIGMLVAGILVGSSGLDVLPEIIMELSSEIRLFTLLVILLKAGMALDKEKILMQGSVAARLAFLPSVVEAYVVALATRYLFGWDWISAWLTGWILCAASPAVIVPTMLRLKSEGWGVAKGIPDLILTEGTASDAVAVTMFGIFSAWAVAGVNPGLTAQLFDIPIQIVLGVIVGIVAGRLVIIPSRWGGIARHPVRQGIITLIMGIVLVLGDVFIPYSPFLALMVMGFVILEADPVLTRRVRIGLERVWVVAEIFLFVLIGAAVDIRIITEVGGAGLVVVAAGLIIGRFIGMFASTLGSTITYRERLFMVVGDSAKATVQAAIGGIPLALGLPHGEYILALAVIAILVTAPLGALGTRLLAPLLLERGEVDPTRVTVHEHFKFLVAIVGVQPVRELIREAARVARRVDGSLLILNVYDGVNPRIDPSQLQEELRAAQDVPHELILVDEQGVNDAIQHVATEHGADYIYLTSHRCAPGLTEQCGIPVITLQQDGCG